MGDIDRKPPPDLFDGLDRPLEDPIGVVVEPAGDVRPPPPGFPRVIDVTLPPFGARGDGTTPDTEAIQAALDAAPEGGVVYFPAGDYRVGALVIHSRTTGLTLMGDGPCSRLLRRFGNPIRVEGVESDDGAEQILTVTNSNDITLERLGFETEGASGFERPGGVRFSHCFRVRIRACRFNDGRRHAEDRCDDRIAVRFEGTRGVVSRDVWLQDNEFVNLSVKLAMVARVRVVGNRFIDPVPVGVWIGGMASDSIQEDVRIERNLIVDPWQAAVRVSNEESPSGATTGNSMRRIDILRNRIVRAARDEWVQSSVEGISVGNRFDSPTGGNAFDSIRVEDNTIDLSPDMEPPTWGIRFRLNPIGAPRDDRAEPGWEVPDWDTFARCTIRRNRVFGTRAAQTDRDVLGLGIEAHSLYRCLVGGNVVLGSDTGILLEGGLLDNYVHHNASDSGGVSLGGSIGGNVVYTIVELRRPSDAAPALGVGASRSEGEDYVGDIVSWFAIGPGQ